MKCPGCHKENPETSRFCAECGTQLLPSKELPSSPKIELKTPVSVLAKGGTFVGKYRIIEELGRGGMGIVCEAEDTKLERTVALKFLPPELTKDPQAKARFIQEAQVAAALDHPNICTVYEISEAEGQTYIARAYIKGQSLKEKIAAGSLSRDEVLDIAGQVAEGLREAHEKGIIHATSSLGISW